MRANKVIFDLYSTSGGKITPADYKAYYEANNLVYIVLVDEKIYTKVKRDEMFDKGLNCGCFIEHKPSDTPSQVETSANALISTIGARFVSVNDFISIEEKNSANRVKRAFAVAEKMIREG